MSKISDKINKWIWLSSNKKPPKKYEAYLQTTIWWFLAGFIFGGVIFIVSSSNMSELPVSIFGCVVFIFMGSAFLWAGISDDKRMGKYDAIHKAALEYWHKKRQDYGIETKEEQK